MQGLRVAPGSSEVPGSSLGHGRSPRAPCLSWAAWQDQPVADSSCGCWMGQPWYAGSTFVFKAVIESFSNDLSVKIKS